ncbi:hypothetical protein JOQ06_019535, partial [Pogonophryne albipinna]
KLFNDVLKIPGDFNITRAHREYREVKERARPVIVAFLNFETKKQILQAAWGKKNEGGTTQTYGNPKAAGKALVERGLVCPHRVTKIPGAWNGTPGSDNDGKWIINNGAVGALLNCQTTAWAIFSRDTRAVWGDG